VRQDDLSADFQDRGVRTRRCLLAKAKLECAVPALKVPLRVGANCKEAVAWAPPRILTTRASTLAANSVAVLPISASKKPGRLRPRAAPMVSMAETRLPLISREVSMSVYVWRSIRQILPARRNSTVCSFLRSGIRARAIPTPLLFTSRLSWSVCAAGDPRRVRTKKLLSRAASSIAPGRVHQTEIACRPASEELLWTSRAKMTKAMSLPISKPQLLARVEQPRNAAPAWPPTACEILVCYEGAPPPVGAINGSHNPPVHTPDLYRQGYEGAPPPIGDRRISQQGPAAAAAPLPPTGLNKLQRNNSMNSPASGYRRPSFTGGRLSSLFSRNKRNKDEKSENYRDEYFNHHTPPPTNGSNGKDADDVRPYAARGPSTDYYDDEDSLPYSDEGEVYDERPLPPAGQPRAAATMPARRPSKAERFLGLEAGEGDNRRMSMQGGRSTLEEGEWDGPGYDDQDDYFGDVGATKKKGWKGILGRS
jgi:hypothetical protein